MKAITLAILCTLVVPIPAIADDIIQIGGNWTATAIPPCGCNGTHSTDTTIQQSGDYVLLRNECGMISPGKITDFTVDAFNWHGTGVVYKDRKQILWPTGCIWTRPSAN
jgi:hypothetical protein